MDEGDELQRIGRKVFYFVDPNDPMVKSGRIDRLIIFSGTKNSDDLTVWGFCTE